MGKRVKHLTTQDGLNKALSLAAKKKYFTLSEKLAEKKTMRDFIIDELTLPKTERKSRRDIVYELMQEYFLSRVQAYRIYNEVVSDVTPAQSFSKYELQMYLYEEYMTAIDATYAEDELDSKGLGILLGGLQKLKDNWEDMPVEEPPLPIPIFSSQPSLLPNYKEEMQRKIEAVVAKIRATETEKIKDVIFEEL
jgi:hypothetical protein